MPVPAPPPPTTVIDPTTGFAICNPADFRVPNKECTDAVDKANQLRFEAANKCREAQRVKSTRDTWAAAAAAAYVLSAALVASAIAAAAVGGFIGQLVAAFLAVLASAALGAAIGATIRAYQANKLLDDVLLDFDKTVRDWEVQASQIARACCPGQPPVDLTVPQCML